MGVPISNVTRRVVYAASGTGPYAFTFEILANTDIAVYKDDTLLTLTTDYTVTIASNGTGSITLVASPTGATQIAIVGNRSIQRTTDFVTGGDFFANTVNDEMDQQTIFAQQNAEGLLRALSAPQTDPTTINMTLPRASLRASKYLGFDSDGNPTIADTLGTNRGNWASGTIYYLRDIIKDTTNNNIWQCITSHTSTGSQPIGTNTDSAKWSLLVDAASATTSASNAATSATNAANSATSASSSATSASSSASSAASDATAAASAKTAAESARDATLAAYDSFDDRYLGAKTSDPSVDNDGNALITGAIYWNSTSNNMFAWTGSAWGSISSTADIYRYRYTATGGETSKSGADDNGLTLSYIVGKEQVYLNGVLLVRTTDYVATNGTSIASLAALAAGDILEIITFTAFELANVISPTLFDAKGDILVATSADTAGKLTVGTNGYYLKADSSTATGLAWAAVSQYSLPSQTGNAGKYLTTDGSTESWATVTTDPTADIFMMMGA